MTSTDQENGASPATTPRVLSAVTAALERLVWRNDSLAASEETTEGRRRQSPPLKSPLDVFRAARVPGISVGSYLDRLYQYSDCSPSCFVLGFVYIDRLAHQHPSAMVMSVNVHRLILTSVVVASKVLDDVHHTNAFFAKVGGVGTEELNRLELELLFLLDFAVAVDSRAFEGYCLHLEKEMRLCNGRHEIVKFDGGGMEDVATPRSALSSFSPRRSF